MILIERRGFAFRAADCFSMYREQSLGLAASE
jgi:hypothetical protein